MIVSSSPTYRAMGFAVALILAGFASLVARQSLTFTPELHAWDLPFSLSRSMPSAT